MKRALVLVTMVLVVVAPSMARADDAGLDLGDAAPGCTDGLNAGDIAACGAKKAGEGCLLPDGVGGSCAELRCLDANGQRVLFCVAPAAPPTPPASDASASASFAAGTAGGGCAVGSRGSGDPLSLAGVVGCAVLAARRRRREKPRPCRR